ncbi:hypothetical protein GCM10023185_30020 [Hymenobacter saemangeumensis]|uniref:DNA-binding protein n=1 Tax=Hymenobacter saemangeumensis TaxID=1084522 RepID=A0ABP8IM95_9BACT
MERAAISLQLDFGQVLNVSLSSEAELQLLTAAACRFADAKAEAEVLGRTYHMGTKPTPGLDYDDRLWMRITGHSVDTLYKYLALPVRDGGLRHKRLGNKYLVTEEDILEFLGSRRKLAA